MPVLLVKQASDVRSSGWERFLRVLVHPSVALGIFYFLPFQTLAGDRIVVAAMNATGGR